MDLLAYAQIEDLDELVKKNDIVVPRLRGYRLMRDEELVVLNDKELRHNIELSTMERLCQSAWGRSEWVTFNNYTKWRCEYFIENYEFYWSSKDKPGYKEPQIRWDRIKGKNKRIFITKVKNELRRYHEQYDVWNKYAGKGDILYIHARIGGGNWPSYYTEVVGKPWFIEKVDDAYDSTYCDIYARLKENTCES